MVRIRAWFVTATRQPDRRLDGPYRERAACERACLLMADREQAALRLAEGRRGQAYYVPRMFVVEIAAEAAPLYSAPETREPPATPRAQRQPKALPDVVYTYNRTGLLALCRAMGFGDPATRMSRAEILIYIEQQLADLAR